MKNIFTLFTGILFCVAAYAQCVPDTSMHSPGYSPDSATGLPHAVVGVPYSEVIQVLVPATYTTYNLDSVVLNSVTGLPVIFNYSCTPSNCHLMPLANGCLLISGPAFTASSAGNIYYLSINLTVYVHIAGFSVPLPQSVTFYTIVVDQSAGISALSKTRFDVAQNYPNPFSDHTSFAFSSTGNENISMKIYNMLGTLVSSRSMISKSGVNYTTLEARNFTPGIYMVSMSNGKATITRRMIVVKNQ